MYMTEKMKESLCNAPTVYEKQLACKQTIIKEANFYRLITSAALNAGSYTSPTDEDIAEAGPEWKPSLPKIEVQELSHLPKRRNPTSYDWWWA